MQKLILLLLLFISVASNAQPVKAHGQLSVMGTQLVDKHKKPFVLNGVSLGWSCFHPRFYTKGTIAWLGSDWKCNVVRAAIGVEPDHGYLQDSLTNLRLVKTVVEAAIEKGLYVIIDWHSHNIKLPEAQAFFTEMAMLYHQYPNIIYELFNEPDYETWAEVKDYSQQLIKTIRAIDPKNIILVGSPHWDQDIQLPASDPIKGFTNIMYSVHFYAGTHKQWLRDRTDSAILKGLPVFISESAGMEASGDGRIDAREWDRYIRWMDKRKLSWITWSVSDKNESCSMLNTSASSDGNWNASDLKESGILTRKYLRKKN